eukprot:2607317-Prymnesium_polylepis.2
MPRRPSGPNSGSQTALPYVLTSPLVPSSFTSRVDRDSDQHHLYIYIPINSESPHGTPSQRFSLPPALYSVLASRQATHTCLNGSVSRRGDGAWRCRGGLHTSDATDERVVDRSPEKLSCDVPVSRSVASFVSEEPGGGIWALHNRSSHTLGKQLIADTTMRLAAQHKGGGDGMI